MSPAHYSRFAEHAFPFRWWFGLTSVIGFALVVLLAMHAGALGVYIAAIIAGPLIGLPWAALCAAIWFHPVHGNIQPTSRIVGRFPKPMQAGMRWYAAVFLSIFVLVCAVGWPLFALATQ